MTMAEALALLGLLVGIVGVAVDATWVWASGVAATVWYLVVASADHDGVRGFLSFLSIPAILAVAILTSP